MDESEKVVKNILGKEHEDAEDKVEKILGSKYED